VAACRILCGVAVESCSEIFKPIVELSNVAVISKLCNVRGVELDAFVAGDRFGATRINLAVVVKGQSMGNMGDNRALRGRRIAFRRGILSGIPIPIDKLQ